MPADNAAEQNPADTGTPQVPRENPFRINPRDLPKAVAMSIGMDAGMAALGYMMPGGWPAMLLLDLFLIHPLQRRSHHSLDYIKATLPRECATFMRAALIRSDDDALRSMNDTARLGVALDQTDLNILNAKGFALLQLENQMLKDPQTGPMHRILDAVIHYQATVKSPLNDASMDDAQNPLAANGASFASTANCSRSH